MSLDTSTHKNILIRILKDIYTDATIGPFLGFKGGTAALLFYDLNRFSTDLDFDLLDLSKKDYIFNQLKTILSTYGTIKSSYETKSNLLFQLAYNNKVKKAVNIEIDVNLRDFGSHYEVKSYLGISMKVMVREDMAAHKMAAMLERNTNRDIFDTYFFLEKNWPSNEHIIEKRTNLSMSQFLQKCINKLESMSDRDILSGIGDLLDPKQKVWVKAKLRTETIFLLRVRLENYPTPPA